MALMGNKRRQATARVPQGQRAKVVELTARDFELLLGSSDAFQKHVQDLTSIREKQIEEGNRQQDHE
jgi:hypothetical protein